MKMMTKAIEQSLPKLGATENLPNEQKQVVVKYFTPDSSWTWYVAEGEKDASGDFRFFGYVEGFENEWGYFTLGELACARGPLGLKVERDYYFSGTFDEIRSLHAH